MRKFRASVPIALAASLGLVLSGCAGAGAEEQSDGEQGFEFGAPQEEVNELIADLEPVTLTYQPSAGSPNSVLAQSTHAFVEAVEERSNGQITLDIAYGQAIAGYGEVIDALNDGRIDIATHLPVYEPSDFPTYDALATSMSGLPISPVVGEAVHAAMAAELGEKSEGLRAEFEAQGVTPIAPLMSAGGYYGLCNSEDTSAADWAGNQTRVASTAHHAVVENIGATPVSLEWVETFEALQRGTVDCSMAQLHSSSEGGVPEVAPYIIYSSDENSMSSRTVAAELAGPSFNELPLAYQQIIYDARWVEGNANALNSSIDGIQQAVIQAKGAGGAVVPFDEEVDEAIGEANEELLASVREKGLVSDELLDSIPELGEKWENRVQELGYQDEGDFEELDEWWEPGEVDFTELTEAIYTEVGMENRPK